MWRKRPLYATSCAMPKQVSEADLAAILKAVANCPLPASLEEIRRVNRITRGWSNYYHYGHCTRVFGRQQVWLLNRVRRWLWRKYDCKHGLFSFFHDARLLGQYQLWPLPLTAPWRR
jgi:hypothetical protein